MSDPLSAKITERVRRPHVASISMLFSRASEIILFIGAESGLTIEIIRPTATILPKPILINFIFMTISFVNLHAQTHHEKD